MRFKTCSLLVAAASLACSPTATRPGAPSPLDFFNSEPAPAELLLVGVFHFDDPGQDSYKPRFRVDVLSEQRQREIAELVGALAAFRPTKVAVEATPDQQARLDSLLNAHLAGRHELGTNEIYQLGFRLAKSAGLKRVYAADAPSRSLLTGPQVEALMQKHALKFDSVKRAIDMEPYNRRYQQLYAFDDSIKTVQTLREHLLYINSPERVRLGHGSYSVAQFKLLGPDKDYLGPDDVTQWYNRNLRIFSNLQHMIDTPNERILMIIGAGHLPILQFVAGSSPDVRLRQVSDFLR